MQAEYAFMHSRDMDIKGLHMTGKYSFQYVQDVVIRDSVLDTKDAFWHSKNVTVYDSVVKGEYLAWYSEGLTLIRCKISGTQPLCYCKNLTLIDCEMEGADFAFENSEVEATITTPVISIKNPLPWVYPGAGSGRDDPRRTYLARGGLRCEDRGIRGYTKRPGGKTPGLWRLIHLHLYFRKFFKTI